MEQILGVRQNLTFLGCWWAKDIFRRTVHILLQELQKQLSTGGWWCWCHFSPCSENHCGRLFKGDQLGWFLEFFDLQVKIMRLFKNKQRCCSNEAGCCCEFGCTVCLSSCVSVFYEKFSGHFWYRHDGGDRHMDGDSLMVGVQVNIGPTSPTRGHN